MADNSIPKQGDIVLIPIPFTDLSSQKQRPVIVISNDAYQQNTRDIVVVALTSNVTVTEYGFVITTKDLVKGMLNRPSQVRVDKIYTLAQAIVIKHFGQVNKTVLTQIRQHLQSLTSQNVR